MITVIIDKYENKRINAIYMNGHSGFSTSGTDIVCAGASTLFYTLANSLEDICMYDTNRTSSIIEDDGEGNVRASIVLPQDSDNSNADRAQVLMRMAHIGFITLASSANTDGNRYIEVIEGK